MIDRSSWYEFSLYSDSYFASPNTFGNSSNVVTVPNLPAVMNAITKYCIKLKIILDYD
jgi:hypothetical protein